jgi:peptidoglycan/LPS O-acetylase OafA/YrhL
MDRFDTETNNRNIIITLQGLRALAFCGIFLSHTEYKMFSSLGSWGVSFFLILSGFLMIINYSNSGRLSRIGFRSNGIFALKKIGKLYPLHLLALLSAVALEMLAGRNIKDILLKAVLNITMLEAFVPYQEIYYSLNAVSWYLSVILFIYFCFPWVLQACEQIKSKRAAVLGIFVLFAIQITVCFVADNIGVPEYIGFSKWMIYICPPVRIIDFIIGCLFGFLYIRTVPQAGNKRSLQKVPVFIVYACITYTMVILYCSCVNNWDHWWSYTVVHTLSNGVMIYCISLVDKGAHLVTSFFSFKALVWLGNLSAFAFIIHQMVIRYIKFLNFASLFENPFFDIFIKVFLPFFITVFLCFVYRKISKETQLDSKVKNRKNEDK